MNLQNIPNCNYPYLSIGWMLAAFKHARILDEDLLRFPLLRIAVNEKCEMEWKTYLLDFRKNLNCVVLYSGEGICHHYILSVRWHKVRLLNCIGLNGPSYNMALRQLCPPSEPYHLMANTLEGLVISGYDFNNDGSSLFPIIKERKFTFDAIMGRLYNKYAFRPNLVLFINAFLRAYLYDIYKGDIVQKSLKTKLIFEQLDKVKDTKIYSQIFNDMQNGTFKFDINQWVSPNERILLPSSLTPRWT